MQFSVENFKQHVLKKGLARANNFEVIITPPSSLAGQPWNTKEDLSLMCEGTTLPQVSVGIRPLRIFGPAHHRPHSIEFGGEGLPFTFLVDQQMTQKKFFDAWITSIVNFNDFTVTLADNYKTKIKVYQLDNAGNPVYGIELLEAFPRSVNMIELNHSTRDTFHRCTVTFTYRRWIPLSEYSK